MDPKTLASLIKSDKASDIPIEVVNAAWTCVVDLASDGCPTALHCAAECASTKCFELFCRAMCAPEVWQEIDHRERGRLELEFLSAVSTYYMQRRMRDNNSDAVARAAAGDALMLFFQKDGEKLILAQRDKASFEKFGAAFEEARFALDVLLACAQERASLNDAVKACAPEGVMPPRL